MMINLFRIFALISLSLSVTACGFKPMYGGQNNEIVPELSSIRIERIDDREGQILRNQLHHLLTPYGPAANPDFSLRIRLSSSRESLGYRKDATPRRARIRMTAVVQLRELSTGSVIYADQVSTMTGFAIGPQAEIAALPEIVSEEDAKRRLLELIADEIKMALSAYFSKKTQSNPQK